MFQYLYLSRLAEGEDFTCFKSIVTTSRQRNPAQGMAGALLFDGERFCQLLEGPENPVRALAARIDVDPRHTGIVLLHIGEGSLVPTRYSWSSGYCGADDLDVFEPPHGPRGPAAVKAFASLLAQADLVD